MASPQKLLLKKPCPACGQGFSLVPLRCPHCFATVLACEEDGTVFPKLDDLSQQSTAVCDVWHSAFTRCPRCLQEALFDFAGAADVRRAGGASDDYV
jgi:hypothetical protein